MKILIVSFLLSIIIVTPSFALTFPTQKEDKVINNVIYSQWFMEGNGWEVRAFFNKKTDDLSWIKLWRDDGREYLAQVGRLK